MVRSFDRPYQPLEITESTVASFSLLAMGHQLMQEEVFGRLGRDSLSLVRHQNLTVVLLVLDTDAVLPEHQAPGPITVTVLAGHIDFLTSEGAKTLSLKTGDTILCAAHLLHSVKAREKSIILLVIGGQGQGPAESSVVT